MFQKLCIPRPSTKHTSSVQHLQIQAPDLPGGPPNLYSIFNSTSKPGVQKTMPKSWSLFILLKCWEAGLRPLTRIAIIYCNTTLLLLDPWKTINIIGLYLSRPPTPQPLPPPTKKTRVSPDCFLDDGMTAMPGLSKQGYEPNTWSYKKVMITDVAPAALLSKSPLVPFVGLL